MWMWRHATALLALTFKPSRGLVGSEAPATAGLSECGTTRSSANASRALALAVHRLGRATTGSVLVIGANVGAVQNDPTFAMLASPSMAAIDKVFVEPMPALFRQLQANVANMSRANAVNAAIANVSGHVDMYCFGDFSGKDGHPHGKMVSFLKACKCSSQLCSMSKARLFSRYDVLSKASNSHTRGMVEELITSTQVPALTVKKLLHHHVPAASPVVFVQIDVEGFDDHVLASLPLGDALGAAGSSFAPHAIVFEHVLLGEQRLQAAMDRLRTFGYAGCIDQQNVVAVLGRGVTRKDTR